MGDPLRIQIRQVSASTAEAAIRDHRIAIDRPVAKGGADAGPMGGELFLAAIGGCFMSNLMAAIKVRGLDLPGLRIEVTADLAGKPDRYTSVELCVTADGAVDAVLEKLVEVADRGCIMMNTLRAKLDVRMRVLNNMLTSSLVGARRSLSEEAK